MATLLILKRRIKTTRNVSKTTKAMQMIAASKLKKAEDAALASKPYVKKLSSISKDISQRIDKDEWHEFMKIPQKTNAKLIIVIAPDKGLCGGLVTNLTRELVNQSEGQKIYFIAVGKKAEHAVFSLNKELISSFPFGNTLPQFDLVYPIIKAVEDYFLEGKVSEVILLTTKYINVFSQIPDASILLPVRLDGDIIYNETTVFEPNIRVLLPDLLRHYLEMSIFQSLLESYASEQSARMIAMKNATDNASDIISELQLEYNKTRQEKITNELLDITGGSKASYE